MSEQSERFTRFKRQTLPEKYDFFQMKQEDRNFL